MRPVPNSLHDEVASRLREQIFGGALPPGSFLDEAALCERLEISRTPLREALKVLAAEGLVRHEPRRGCFVNQITERDLDEIFPVIALLEGRCAFEAARNATDADLAALIYLVAAVPGIDSSPMRLATTIQKGSVKGLVMNVTKAASGTLAREGSARKAARKICPMGTMKAANSPSATPRGTERRVKRHNSGERKRCAMGARYLFSAISSRVGVFLRITSAAQARERPAIVCFGAGAGVLMGARPHAVQERQIRGG